MVGRNVNRIIITTSTAVTGLLIICGGAVAYYYIDEDSRVYLWLLALPFLLCLVVVFLGMANLLCCKKLRDDRRSDCESIEARAEDNEIRPEVLPSSRGQPPQVSDVIDVPQDDFTMAWREYVENLQQVNNLLAGSRSKIILVGKRLIDPHWYPYFMISPRRTRKQKRSLNAGREGEVAEAENDDGGRESPDMPRGVETAEDAYRMYNYVVTPWGSCNKRTMSKNLDFEKILKKSNTWPSAYATALLRVKTELDKPIAVAENSDNDLSKPGSSAASINERYISPNSPVPVPSCSGYKRRKSVSFQDDDSASIPTTKVQTKGWNTFFMLGRGHFYAVESENYVRVEPVEDVSENTSECPAQSVEPIDDYDEGYLHPDFPMINPLGTPSTSMSLEEAIRPRFLDEYVQEYQLPYQQPDSLSSVDSFVKLEDSDANNSPEEIFSFDASPEFEDRRNVQRTYKM